MGNIWIDISDLRQVRLLSTLAMVLSEKTDVKITCSGREEILRILDSHSLSYSPIDVSAPSILRYYCNRIFALTKFVKENKPDLLLTDLDPGAVRTAFGLGVPIWSFFQTPLTRNLLAERMSYPLCEKVFSSSFFEESELLNAGVRPGNIEYFDGWNECHLKDHPTIQSLNKNRYSNSKIMLKSRGVPEYWLRNFIEFLTEKSPDTKLSLLGKEGRSLQRNQGIENISFTPKIPPLGQSVFIGSGRILAESFVLGVPTVATEAGKNRDLELLHQHVSAFRDPKSVASRAIEYLDQMSSASFFRRSRKVVQKLESPVKVLLSHI